MKRIEYKSGDLINGCEFVLEAGCVWDGYRRCWYAWFVCPFCGNGFRRRISDVRSGNTSSCGCLSRKNAVIHGLRYHPLYSTWLQMKNRCYNKNAEGYKNYGGRGIEVCDEWCKDFRAFYDYVTALPHYGEEGMTLDREDNEGNYEPGNVRWADRHVQAANSRINSNNTSGYVGVELRGGRYNASIRVNGTEHCLGGYLSPDLALMARNKYIKENELWEYPIQAWRG